MDDIQGALAYFPIHYHVEDKQLFPIQFLCTWAPNIFYFFQSSIQLAFEDFVPSAIVDYEYIAGHYKGVRKIWQ